MSPSLLVLLILLCAFTDASVPYQRRIAEKDEVILVHVLFRHGNRTANGPGELYPKDPYLNKTYYPFGLGQLTNAGKRREFGIGKALRDRYDGFLGEYYTPEIVDAVSTDFNRTKMSLELVLASLFPPKGVEIWNNILNWQPIPFNYFPAEQDKVLIGVSCPRYVELYSEQTKSPKQQREFSWYRDAFRYISRNSGLNVTTFNQVYNLYFGLSTEEEYGLQLPAWTKSVWPTKITNMAIKEYYVATANTDLKRMAAGYHLKKILEDTEAKISGRNQDRKIYLYSAHESNVAHMLLTLDIFNNPHIPNYGSYIVFEIGRSRGVYGVKIYYENYTGSGPILMKLPGCAGFCPLNQFVSIVQEYIPSEDLCNDIHSEF